MADRLKNIGNTLMMPERIDEKQRVSRYQRRNMRVVDLIPVTFSFLANEVKNLAKITKNKFKGGTLKYNYFGVEGEEGPIEKFKRICGEYGIVEANNLAGVRLWLTDETTSNESFTNNYTTNLIEQGITNLGTKWKSFSQLHRTLRSTGQQRGTEFFTDIGTYDLKGKQLQLQAARASQDTAVNREKIKTLEKEVVELKENPSKGAIATSLTNFAEYLGVSKDSDLVALAKGLVGVIGRGETFNMPKIWDNSDYSPVMSLNIKLVSPYGSPKAIKKFILEPLLCLLILTAPRSSNNITVGEPSPLRVKTYGINNINFGAVKNIQIRRGGGNITYNKYRQPLSLDLSLQIETLFGGFAALSTGDDIKITEFDKDVSQQGDIDDTVESRSFTTIGDVIKSFRPFTGEQGVNDPFYQSGRTWTSEGFFDREKFEPNQYYSRTQPVQTFAERDGKYFPSEPFDQTSFQAQTSPNNASTTAISNSLDDKKL
jgi:hypothetical protein